MSDGQMTIRGSASSGFIRQQREHGRYELASALRKTDQPLRGQVRQEGVAWNTYLFLLDAHKRTGERHVSAQRRASSVLLGGRRTPITHANEYDNTRGGSIDA